MAGFWSRLCVLGIVGLFLSGALLVCVPQRAQAADGGRQTENFVSVSYAGSSVMPGDWDRELEVYIHNDKATTPYNLYNVSAHIGLASNEPKSDPFIWKEGVAGSGNFEDRYNLSYSNGVYLYGVMVDVQDDVQVGTYNFTVTTNYQYMVTGDPVRYPGSEEDIVTVSIIAMFSVGTQIYHYYDSASYPPSRASTLFSGETFQKVGFSVSKSGLSGRNLAETRVTATLVERSGVDYTGFTWDRKTATIMNYASYSYFFFRLSIGSEKKSGIYDYSVELKYTRKDSYSNSEMVVCRETSVLSIMVDFTPLMEMTSNVAQTVAQGSTQAQFNVMLRNNGNCDLSGLKVWLDIDNYFTYTGGAYYDGYGYREYEGTEIKLPNLLKGTQNQVQFNLDVAKYIPAGEHRLPLRYSGYFYDDGSYSYSDWKMTTDSTYSQIKGESPYIKVNVMDQSVDVLAESSASLSLAHPERNVGVTVQIINKEEVQYDDVVLTLNGFPRTNPIMKLLLNPMNAASGTLQQVSVLSLPASSSIYATFYGDVSTAAKPGSYELDLNFTATDHNTRQTVSKTLTVPVRLMPGPPSLEMTPTFDPPQVKAGRSFSLEVQLANTGQDAARDVTVELLAPSGASSGILVTGELAEVYAMEGMLCPLSVANSHAALGDIEPAAGKGCNYTVTVDRNIAKGTAYPLTIRVSWKDLDGNGYNSTTEISLAAQGSPPQKAAQPDPLAAPLTLGAILIILVWVLFVVGAIIIKKVGAPRRPPEPQLAPVAPLPPPPTSPPPMMAPAPPQYFPPPPPPPQ